MEHMNVSLKMPPKMKRALDKLAEREFTSASSVIKKALEEYLSKNGIDWRQEKPEKKAKNPRRPREQV
jgi:Arc/MetJ-type ribon-helix-helix transcriptional regulator